MNGSNWNGWNNGQSKPVIMTEEHVRAIVDSTVNGVSSVYSTQLVEHYKLFAQTQFKLEQALAESSRKDVEIASLREQIARLNSFMSQVMAAGASGQMVLPYNGGGSYIAPNVIPNTTGALPAQVPSLFTSNGHANPTEVLVP